jgi:hypothetical protein
MIEPSNTERAEWPDTTRDYVEGLEAKLEAAERENSKDCTGCMYKSRGIDRIYNCDKCARFYSDRFKALTQEDKRDE